MSMPWFESFITIAITYILHVALYTNLRLEARFIIMFWRWLFWPSVSKKSFKIFFKKKKKNYCHGGFITI
jgi:hypothetical protein